MKIKDSEQKLLQLKEEKQKSEEDINLLQLWYDVLEHELSAKKIDVMQTEHLESFMTLQKS
jgi:hypothetical protein